ncbi:type II secretion system protein GspC [Colwellia sp. RSH04]|uniref:type II secretion system protein GspC n=1 Tax=Colwellia sp. RSH04 TaxID=2305464 RepID=UPI000E59355E|nr:type II secretion system protein GspC [Colwellia sp. RSH04]RHW77968.1 type II secretion system protein GspC [Colwellia sp. RSH04]
MALSIDLTSFTPLLTKLAQKKTAQVVSVILITYIAYVMAQMTWLFVPQTDMSSNVALVSKNKAIKSDNKSFNLNELQTLNLFGVFTEKEVQASDLQAQDAPQTNLKLVLSGLVASDSKETAAAIIEHQGKQETYGIGDLIVGTRASLEKVLMDRVLIKRAGQLETLMLDGFDYKQPAYSLESKARPERKPLPSPQRTKGTAEVIDQRANKALQQQAKTLRADLSDNPGKITDHLRIHPKRKNGKIVGYALRPGKKPEFFKLSGLKSGDVAVQMNGYDLTSTRDAAKALAEMKQAKDVSLLVERKGSLTEILFSIEP